MSFRATREAETAKAAPSQAQPVEGAPASSRQTWLLVVCCVAQFMVILDLTIVNVALPSIQSALNFSPISLQWVVDAYAIVFAGFLMLGGRVSDRFGRRNSLVVALTLFALASLAGGAAIDQGMLIIARATQGLSGALMAAASLAAITAAFPPGPARHRAIGLWSAMNGAGGAAGALFGGVITQELGWRWVLLINPPIGIAAAIVAYLVVANDGNPVKTKFDIGGALTLTGGQVILAYGFVNGGNFGWTALVTVGPIVIGLAVLVLFGVIEARWATAPLVPVKTISKSLRTANLIVLSFSAALFPMWFLSSLYMQQVLGLSPLVAGLAFFPMSLVILLVAQRAGKLTGRFGVRTVLTCGLLMMASGMLLLSRIGPSGSALGFVIFPGCLVAAGIALSIVPSTIAATQGATPAQAGLASGMVNTSRQVGGALGIALLISIATEYTSHLIGANKPVPDSLTAGFRIGYLICVGLVLVAAAISFFGLAKHAPAAAQAAPGAPAATGAPAAPAVPEAPARPRALRSRLVQMPVIVLAVIALWFGIDFAFAGGPGAPVGSFSSNGAYNYVSAPGLHPPVIVSDIPTGTGAGSITPGLIMMTNFYDLTSGALQGQSGPLILDNNLQPVWFKPVPKSVVAADLAMQTYHGKPVLTWWQGKITDTGATTSGEYVVVNKHYKTIATLQGANGWILTLHTMVISGDDAWVTANKDIPMDLGHYGGVKDGALTDAAVQEYNLKTGKLVRNWDALDHISLKDTHALPPNNSFPWDAYHVNSISLNGDGTMTVSMRNTWAVYDIDIKSGKILWTLGGRHSTWKVSQRAAFEWQHDVTMLPGNKISMFDDACCQLTGADTYLAPDGPSRGLILRLHPVSKSVTMVAQYEHNTPDAAYMGSTQVLPKGNVFVGFGSEPYFAEYSKSGRLLLDAILPGPDLSYRTILSQGFVGTPLTRPAEAVRGSGSHHTVYISWNGATQATGWRLLAGPSASQLKVVATKPKLNFETAISVQGQYKVFKVEALDANGAVIGTSRAVDSK